MSSQFKQRVYSVVEQIPPGRVMTYGQIAAICGNPRASRVVGGIAHFGPTKYPWQRVVNKKGGLARGYWGGKLEHKRALEAEGAVVYSKDGEYKVDIKNLIWYPDIKK